MGNQGESFDITYFNPRCRDIITTYKDNTERKYGVKFNINRNDIHITKGEESNRKRLKMYFKYVKLRDSQDNNSNSTNNELNDDYMIPEANELSNALQRNLDHFKSEQETSSITTKIHTKNEEILLRHMEQEGYGEAENYKRFQADIYCSDPEMIISVVAFQNNESSQWEITYKGRKVTTARWVKNNGNTTVTTQVKFKANMEENLETHRPNIEPYMNQNENGIVINTNNLPEDYLLMWMDKTKNKSYSNGTLKVNFSTTQNNSVIIATVEELRGHDQENFNTNKLRRENLSDGEQRRRVAEYYTQTMQHFINLLQDSMQNASTE